MDTARTLQIFLYFFCGLVASAGAQTIVYVSPNGTGDGSSWAQAAGLADAVQNAPDDAGIWLKQGVYEITATLEFPGYGYSGVSLYGGFNGTETGLAQRDPENNPTILNGLGERRILNIEVDAVTIDGLIFTGGFADDENNGGGALHISASHTTIRKCVFRANISEGSRGAGAIYNRSGSGLLIDDCLFEENRTQNYVGDANGGGAIHNWADDVVITRSVFRKNSSHNSGGAIYTWYASPIRIEHCIFNQNYSNASGGAIHTRSETTISNTDFAGNRSDDEGGAIFTGYELHLSGSTLTNNRAGIDGGAIYVNGSSSIDIARSIFSNNRATGNGGALFFRNGSEGTVLSTLLSGNQAASGGAVFNYGNVRVANATFVGNSNHAFVFRGYSDVQSDIYNSIFRNNTATDGTPPDIALASPAFNDLSLDIRRNLLQVAPDPDWGSANLIGMDPLFTDAATGDYTLQSSSPVINAGANALFNNVSDINAGASIDLAGNPRVRGGVIDLGAYEADPSTPAPPECTLVTSPTPGATDVPLDAAITWESVAGATGYRLFIGNTPGGSEVVNGEEVSGTSYQLPAGFEEATTYYARVVPYNAAGEATGCGEISFTTETLLTAPECTFVTSPAAGESDVPLNAAITWESAAGAMGYRLFIGTTPGGGEVVNGEEVSGTSYQPTAAFEEATTYYVRVVPYNAAGPADDDAGGGDCEEISFTTETLLTAPECTLVTSPTPGATDVPLDAAITWESAAVATGYRVFIGTTSGGGEVVNGEEVSGTSYQLAAVFEEATTYYVRVVPYNAAGSANDDGAGCGEISFTTETLLTAPECATINNPATGASEVPLNATITWEAAAGATGYRVFIGTTPGGAEVVNGEEVSGTSYQPEAAFEENTTYYVRVVPYNAAGEATGCGEISFTTETLLTAPECTFVTSPAAGASDVPLNAAITWESAAGATGYRLFIGNTPGGGEVVNGEEVSGTSYQLAAAFEEATTYYARVVSYNAAGEAVNCGEISFTTETLLTAPECTTINNPAAGASEVPLNATITWEAAPGATGYRVFIGTTPGGAEVVNGEEVSGTSYQPEAAFEEATTYYARVVSYNAAGEAVNCGEISFTTETLLTVPECTFVTSPASAASDVPLNAAITWESAAGAMGYRLFIGTTPGGGEVVNGEEVSGTSYQPTAAFEEATTYYVRVVPYNAAGEAAGCGEISFTTETLLTAPECTLVTSPTPGATDVPLNAAITWESAAGATGYRLFIGNTPGGGEVVNGEAISGTSYQPVAAFAEHTTYYVRVVPYNAAGSANDDGAGCGEISFTTEAGTSIARTKYGISPDGDGINDLWKIDGIARYPDNIVSIYNRWGDMVFQTRRYDNQSNVFTGNANRLTSLGAGALPSGTYFFSIKYRDSEQMKSVNGFLVLRR